jgi:hypothetical protein
MGLFSYAHAVMAARAEADAAAAAEARRAARRDRRKDRRAARRGEDNPDPIDQPKVAFAPMVPQKGPAFRAGLFRSGSGKF